MVGVDALDMARTPQRFQATDVEADERLRVIHLLLEAFADQLDLPARLIDRPRLPP